MSVSFQTSQTLEAYRVDCTNSNVTVCHPSILNGKPCSESDVDDELVFIPATGKLGCVECIKTTKPVLSIKWPVFFLFKGITESTVKQQMEVHLNDKSQPSGIRTCMNGKDLALFYWKEKLYCMDEKCPHLGSHCTLWNVSQFLFFLTLSLSLSLLPEVVLFI